MQVTEVGLNVDRTRLWSATSVDGLCTDPLKNSPNGLVQVKCPYTQDDIPLKEFASNIEVTII